MRSISRSNCLETLAAGTAWGVFYQETKFPLHARLWVAQEKVYFIFCMNRRKEQKASLFSHSLQFVPKYFSDSHIYRHKLNFLQFQQNSFLSPTSFYDSQISSFLHCCYLSFSLGLIFWMRSITKLTISLLSTSLLIPQSWKTTRARRTSIVVFDLKAALWSWEAKVNQLCHENTLSGYTPTEGLFSCVTVDSVRDCDTWLLCEMEAKIRTVGQYSKAQVGLIGLLVRKSPTTDSEGEVSSDQGHSCLVYGFLLRLLSCESRVQRKGKKVG